MANHLTRNGYGHEALAGTVLLEAASQHAAQNAWARVVEVVPVTAMRAGAHQGTPREGIGVGGGFLVISDRYFASSAVRHPQ